MKIIFASLLFLLLFGCFDSPVAPDIKYPKNDFVGVYSSENSVSTLTINADHTGTLVDIYRTIDFAWDYGRHYQTTGLTTGIAFLDGGVSIRKIWHSNGIWFGAYGEYY